MGDRNAVVAFVPDPTVSHTAWRVARPLAALAKVGVPTEVVTLPGPSLDGWVYSPAYESVTFGVEVQTLLLHRAIVPIQFRESFTAWIQGVRASGVTVVYDTDDDVYSLAWAEHLVAMRLGVTIRETEPIESVEAREMFAAIRRAENISVWILGQVDGITVSTEHLAKVVNRFTDKLVLVVPNAIDVEAFRAGMAPIVGQDDLPWGDLPDDVPTIGWCAGSRPAADFEPVGEAWRRIAERYLQVRFVMAGVPQPLAGLDPCRVLLMPYTDMDSYPWGMQVDIGCCSAAPTTFNKSRSPIKAWEFALAGAAVVASPTVYGCTLEGGRDAWLAERTVAWESTIANLIEYPATRQAMATNLREKVEVAHALDKNLWRFTDAWKAIRKVSGVSGC